MKAAQAVHFGMSLAVIAAVGVLGTAVPAAAHTQLAHKLKAVVSVTPKHSVVGQRVTASLRKSTRPTGHKITSIRLKWGDHTKPVTLSSLRAKPTHRYARPGHYTVRLEIVDGRHKSAVDTFAETVSPPRGSYTGRTSQGWPVNFYVSMSTDRVQDITISTVVLTCSPGAQTVDDFLTVTGMPIKPNGWFRATAHQSGVMAGRPAKFTYRFAGRFTGVDSNGAPTAGGTFREVVTYKDGGTHKCTSNNQTWTTSRDTQPAQRKSSPAGSYAGRTSQGWPVVLYVAANGRSLQDVDVSTTVLHCTPGNATIDDFVPIAAIPLKKDGSFSGHTTQNGVMAGSPAKFTYSFRGNFHSRDANGAPRAAGTFRESVTYNDGTARTCTSNTQTWTIIRDQQPVQRKTAPPSGTYAGRTSQGWTVSFDVGGHRRDVHNMSIPTVPLKCTPGGSQPNDQLAIAFAPTGASRSFSATAAQNGPFAGHQGHFSYSFQGTFHSRDANGVPRAAGMFRETVTYTDNNIPYTCTSNEQVWYATKSA
jgi:hypothetical protein